jgi:hypothetical protein
MEGVFPKELKLTKVVPVYKKGDIDCAGNFRPISILPSMSKIFEIVIARRLTDFFEGNNFINVSQHGYRKNKSTNTGINVIVETVLELFDAYQCSADVL